MIYFDFHEIGFAFPLLACSLSALLRGKVRAAAIWALPLVFVKEDQGFTVAAIGIVIIVMSLTRAGKGGQAGGGQARGIQAGGGRARRIRTVARGWWALLIVWGLAWSLLAIAVIIPHFNPLHLYPYWTDGGVLNHGVLNPHGAHPSAPSVLAQFGHSYVPKLRTTLLILLPVAFLALGSPLALVALPSLALRFVSTNTVPGSGYRQRPRMPVVPSPRSINWPDPRTGPARRDGDPVPARPGRRAATRSSPAHAGDRRRSPRSSAPQPVAPAVLPDQQHVRGGRRSGPVPARTRRGHAHHAGPLAAR
jgi:hypothetical protein